MRRLQESNHNARLAILCINIFLCVICGGKVARAVNDRQPPKARNPPVFGAPNHYWDLIIAIMRIQTLAFKNACLLVHIKLVYVKEAAVCAR